MGKGETRAGLEGKERDGGTEENEVIGTVFFWEVFQQLFNLP